MVPSEPRRAAVCKMRHRPLLAAPVRRVDEDGAWIGRFSEGSWEVDAPSAVCVEEDIIAVYLSLPRHAPP